MTPDVRDTRDAREAVKRIAKDFAGEERAVQLELLLGFIRTSRNRAELAATCADAIRHEMPGQFEHIAAKFDELADGASDASVEL